jgi:hypothetical protein
MSELVSQLGLLQASREDLGQQMQQQQEAAAAAAAAARQVGLLGHGCHIVRMSQMHHEGGGGVVHVSQGGGGAEAALQSVHCLDAYCWACAA